MGSSETARLLGAAIAEDPDALGDLLERLRPRIVLWAGARMSAQLKAAVDAEDVTQLVLLSAHEGFDRFAGGTEPQLLAWIFSIAENRVRDLARHFGAAKRGTDLAREDLANEIARARAEARCFSRTSPSEAVARRESLDEMYEALERLPEEQRTILRLRDLEMRGYDEIVETMSLPSAGAARTLRCRALIALREAMGVEGKGKG